MAACEPHGTLVLAALGHAGGQGTSHWSQRELWAPSRVPEVNTREVPKWMESADIEAVIDGFGEAAAGAVDAGCDGVEVNAGQFSLARQFLSGLTNQRDDEWGEQRSLFLRRVLAAVRCPRRSRSDRRASSQLRRAGTVGRHHPRTRRRELGRSELRGPTGTPRPPTC